MSEDMKGKVVVITGATSGIGQVAAEELARMGARIVQVARNHERGEAAMERLGRCDGGVDHSIHYADLSLLSEMKRVAGEIARREARVDVLINNAGAMFGSLELTAEGLEKTFALNHLSYFVLTHGLCERLAASAPTRIVSTSSDAHESAALDFEDLQSKKVYSSGSIGEWLRYGGPGFKVYSRSKLCNILFTRELARRVAGLGVTANSFHPGFVATRFGDQSGGLISFGIRVGKRFALTPEEGAKTLVYLASSDEVSGVSGKYFHKCRAVEPSKEAQNDATARRLWKETAKLAGLEDLSG